MITTSNMGIVPIDEPIQKTPTPLPMPPIVVDNPVKNIQDFFPIPMPAQLIYADLTTLNCNNVQQEIDKANQYAMTWKPTPETQAQYEAWLVEANKIKAACATTGTGTGTGTAGVKISKNLTPYVILLGVAVGAIILTKILKK